MARTKKTLSKKTSVTYAERLESSVQSNQSRISMILGALIVLVIGILVFNYFNKNKASLGPAQESQQLQQNQKEDVAKDKLPGSYTVKEGDTLFTISEKYYTDGYKFSEIAETNKLTNPDLIEAGQVLQIPKLEAQQVLTSVQPSASPQAQEEASTGTGGGNTTIWGERIEGNTYTVTADDWLSKIAGRAYGDITAYERIAKANNLTNPDLIEPGQVLTIPR